MVAAIEALLFLNGQVLGSAVLNSRGSSEKELTKNTLSSLIAEALQI